MTAVPVTVFLLGGCGGGSSGSLASDAASSGASTDAEAVRDATSGDSTSGGTPGAESGSAPTGDAAPKDAGVDDEGNTAGLGPAPVDIGAGTDLAAAGGYVLLAKTGITNVTGSSISGGAVGISPAAATFITGFSLILDATSTFSTSSSVVSPGRVYASDYATPTPSNLTTAVLGMQAAYGDAAGRLNPDFLNLGSGDIGGKTLAPGLYTWGTGVTITDDVTLAGGANDVWIFQISNDLDLSSATNVTLTGGAQAAHVFWQVAGQATLHANAHFEGILLCQTAITLQTSASMHGRALAQSLIALDDNPIVAP